MEFVGENGSLFSSVGVGPVYDLSVRMARVRNGEGIGFLVLYCAIETFSASIFALSNL